jgi:general secretion pathway protein H
MTLPAVVILSEAKDLFRGSPRLSGGPSVGPHVTRPQDNGRYTAAGFTLIEMLVVILIIGVMATFAVLYVGNRALEDRMSIEARRLDELVMLAAEQAVMQGTELGLLYTRDGYQFMAMDAKTQRWQAVAAGALRARKVQDPFQIELRIEGRVVPPAETPQAAAETETADTAMSSASQDADADTGPKPQVLLLSSGEVTAFSLDFHARGYGPFFRIEGDVLGRFKMTRLETDQRT